MTNSVLAVPCLLRPVLVLAVAMLLAAAGACRSTVPSAPSPQEPEIHQPIPESVTPGEPGDADPLPPPVVPDDPAAAPESPPDAAEAPTVCAERPAPPTVLVPYSSVPPVIDGHLGDPAWVAVAPFRLVGPLGEEPEVSADVATEVRLLWDEDWLWVAFACRDADILATHREHDAPLYQEDVGEIFIDPLGEGRQYYEFLISPRGVLLDVCHVLSGTPEFDDAGRLTGPFINRHMWSFPQWNCPGIIVAAAMADGGWTVEAAIPARVLTARLHTDSLRPGMAMRANFLRYDWVPDQDEAGPRRLQPQNWSPVVIGCPHISPAAMGHLTLAPPDTGGQP